MAIYQGKSVIGLSYFEFCRNKFTIEKRELKRE